MEPNEVEHEIMRRTFWCDVYAKNSITSSDKLAQEWVIVSADRALEDYDKKFKVLPSIEIRLAGPETLDLKIPDKDMGHHHIQPS